MICRYPFDGIWKYGTAYGRKGKMWSCGWHSGQDFYSTTAGGDGKIHPIAPGKVIRSNSGHKAYGNYVTVQHEDGWMSLYAHMSKRLVKVGDKVDGDSVLGIEGTTGNSTGVHLHIEIHRNAYSYPSKYDPRAFIEQRLPPPAPIEPPTPIELPVEAPSGDDGKKRHSGRHSDERMEKM